VEPISCPVCDKKELEVERIATRVSRIYTIGVVWTSTQVSSDEIKSFLESIAEHIDLCRFEGRVFSSEGEKQVHPAVLRGIMCYYGSHYAAYFRPAQEVNADGMWFMFDDSVVRPIGKEWVSVARSCLASRFQPVALFYETDSTLDPSICSFSGVTL